MSSLLCACGGSSKSTPTNSVLEMSVAASAFEVEAGGSALKLTADVRGSTSPVSWRIESGLGSLSAGSGNSVNYVPPAFASVASSSEVKIVATIGDLSKGLTILLKPTPEGLYAFAGSIGGLGNLDGVGESARFNSPQEIVADVNDRLFILDKRNGLIRLMNQNGGVTTFKEFQSQAVSTIDTWYLYRYFSGRFAYAEPASQPQLILPDGSKRILSNDNVPEFAGYRDLDGNLYEITRDISTGRQTRILKNHAFLAGSFDDTLEALDGKGINARFVFVSSLLVSPNKLIYVLDRGVGSDKFRLREITQDGVVTSKSDAVFESPVRMIPNTGDVPTVLDRNGIHKLSSSGVWVLTPILNGNLLPPKDTHFNAPDATADRAGNIYVANPSSSTIVKISALGQVSNFAGLNSNFIGERLDGALENARFSRPQAMTVDNVGNIYVVDLRAPNEQGFGIFNDPAGLTLRKISTTGVVSTLAAPGIWWAKPDTAGYAEKIALPSAVAVDRNGNLFVLERPVLRGGSVSQNPTSQGGNLIRKISKDGVMTDLNISLNTQGYIAADIQVDGNDNVFVLDRDSIRKLSPDGVITKVMENIGYISAFALDSEGNLFFSNESGIFKHTMAKNTIKLSQSRAEKMRVDANGTMLFAKGCQLSKIASNGTESVLIGTTQQCGNRLGNLSSARLSSVSSIFSSNKNLWYLSSGDAILKLVVQ